MSLKKVSFIFLLVVSLVEEVRDVLLNVVVTDDCQFDLEGTGEAATWVRPAVICEVVDDWGLIDAGIIDLDLIVQTPRVVCHMKESEREALAELLELERVRGCFW